MDSSQLRLRQKHGRIKAYKRTASLAKRYAKQKADYEMEYQRALAQRICKLVD